MKRIYLDYAATTPMTPEVSEVYNKASGEFWGNASSVHTLGRRTKEALERAREQLASSIQAQPREIILTSGGTESNNMAIIQVAKQYQAQGNHIITTTIEHKSVLEPMKTLEKEGFNVTYLPVDQSGCIQVQQIEEALTEDTILVSVMSANNETGTKQPIKAIGALLREHQAIFHTDAVQSYGTEVIDVDEWGVDLLSVSAHKINGPKGMGFLYHHPSVLLPGYIVGGGQELTRRSGTENVPGAVAFAKAVEWIDPLEKQHMYQTLTTRFMQHLTDRHVLFKVNGPENTKDRLPHIISLHFPTLSAEKMMIQLDLNGVEVSAGSACSAGSIQPSHVLTAMFGEGEPVISETIRVSMGLQTTEQDLIEAAERIERVTTALTNH